MVTGARGAGQRSKTASGAGVRGRGEGREGGREGEGKGRGAQVGCGRAGRALGSRLLVGAEQKRA